MTIDLNIINEHIDYHINNCCINTCNEFYILNEFDFKNIKNKITTMFSREEKRQELTKKIKKKEKIVNSKINKLKSELNNQGLDTKKIENAINSKSGEIKNVLKSSKDEKKIGQKLKEFYEDIFHIKDIEDEVEKTKKMDDKYIKATLLLILILFISFLSMNAAALFLPGLISIKALMLINVLLIAPIIEETAKYISVKQKVTGQFFVVFNIVEYISYLSAYTMMGVSIPVIIGLRAATMLMHALTTFIMFKYRKKDPKDKKDLNKTKEYPKIALVIGILIHFIWNLTSVTYF